MLHIKLQLEAYKKYLQAGRASSVSRSLTEAVIQVSKYDTHFALSDTPFSVKQKKGNPLEIRT